MNEITIELSKQEFTGGDNIEGAVLVQLDKDTPLRGIRLVLHGFEEARWREGGGKHRHTHSETRELFKEEITLYGNPRLGFGELVADSLKGVFSKEGYEVLRSGTYQYPFTYALPSGLPSDYESAYTHSRIYYGIKAQVDLPLKLDLKTEQTLVVHEPADRATVQAVTQRHTKNFMFDSDSIIEAEVHLDKDRFQLGEVMVCHLQVLNRAPSKEIRAVELALRQTETARANGRTHVGNSKLNPLRFEECRFPVKDRKAVDLEYPIPEDLYPTITRGELVKLDYELLVALDIPWAVDAKLYIPVTLIRKPDAPQMD